MVYRDKVVLVTGASSGIGRATALAFARRGARLVVAARNRPELEALGTQIEQLGSQCLVVPVDVTQRDQVAAMVRTAVERFGRIDVLVNNAGVGLFASVEEMRPEQWEHVVRVNLIGAIDCIQAVLPEMKRTGGGQIVNISSVLGKRATPYMSVYCATKYALNGFSEALRCEVADDGIDVVVVCPGRTATAFNRNSMAQRRPLGEGGWAGMAAERCAEAIVKAAARRKREVVLTGEGIMLVWAARWFPGLVDRAMLRMKRQSDRSAEKSS